MIIIHLLCYISSMILCELYISIAEEMGNLLMFVMVKYVIGTVHHLLIPAAILLTKTDVRRAVGEVYRRGGSTQSQDMDITYEELQRQLGLGVTPN